jgi:hypothetical protein
MHRRRDEPTPLRSALAVLVAGCALSLSGCAASDGEGGADAKEESPGLEGSCSFAVLFEGRTYTDHPVEAEMRTAAPAGVGTMESCEDGSVTGLSLLEIEGVDPAVAVAAPDIPSLVLIAVPWSEVPASLKKSQRFVRTRHGTLDLTDSADTGARPTVSAR